MATSPPTQLSDEDKLNVLRQLDRFRDWHSLDEKRYCLVCGKIITGRQIQVTSGTRGNGPLVLSCPTKGCNSIPMDWAIPTDEILALAGGAASRERDVILPGASEHRVPQELESQSVKFGAHFQRGS